MKAFCILIWAFLQLAGGMAMAQEAVAVPAATDEAVQFNAVEVDGLRDPDWKPYKAMLQGVAAFDANHQRAPTAALRFILTPRRPDVPMQGITLRLEGAELAIPIELAKDYTFSLPLSQETSQSNAELVLNRRAKTVRWFPHIRSVALKQNQRRLGDLRLECEVLWAIDYETIPFLMRNAVRAMGGPCSMSKGKFSFSETEKLVSATLVAGERHKPLEISGAQFTPPLHDKTWSDDSLIELVFADTSGSGATPTAK